MKTLIKSVREFKTKAIQTPIFVSVEVILECIIPFVMAKLIDEMTSGSMEPVIKYGMILIILGLFSLFVYYILVAKAMYMMFLWQR